MFNRLFKKKSIAPKYTVHNLLRSEFENSLDSVHESILRGILFNQSKGKVLQPLEKLIEIFINGHNYYDTAIVNIIVKRHDPVDPKQLVRMIDVCLAIHILNSMKPNSPDNEILKAYTLTYFPVYRNSIYFDKEKDFYTFRYIKPVQDSSK